MSRFINPDIPFFLNDFPTNGKSTINGLGTIYFGEPNENAKTNPKIPYLDQSFDMPASSTQALSAGGKLSQKLWLKGNYSLIVDDVDDVQIYEDLDWGGSADSSGRIVVDDGYTSLKARSAGSISDGDVAIIEYRDMQGDNGGGAFHWDSTDNTTNVTNDPGQGVYVPLDSDASGEFGVWVRQRNVGFIAGWWYAFDTTGGTDDTAIFANIATLAVAEGGAQIVLPAGTISANVIPFRSKVRWHGLGRSLTKIIGFDERNVFGEATPASAHAECALENMTIDGNRANVPFPTDDEDGNAVRMNQVSFSTFRNLRIQNTVFNALSVYNNSNNNNFENIDIADVGKIGVDPLVFTYCGIFFEAGSSRNKFTNIWINVTKQYGVWYGARDADNFDNTFDNLWIAGTAADMLHVGDEATTNKCRRGAINNFHFLGGGDFGARFFHATGGTVNEFRLTNGTIEDCTNGGVLLNAEAVDCIVSDVDVINNGASGIIDAGTRNFISCPAPTGHTTNFSFSSATEGQYFGVLPADGRVGTFVPTIQFGGTSTGITYSTQEGWYRVGGNIVEFSLTIVLTSNGTDTGVFTIAGLPFASQASGALGSPNVAAANTTYSGELFSLIPNGSSSISMFSQSTGSSSVTLSDTAVAGNSEFYITGTYRI